MLIDCDVHQELGDDDAAIFPYLSQGWQEYVLSPAAGSITGAAAVGDGRRSSPFLSNTIHAEASPKTYANNPFGAMRKDAVPPSGLTAGSDPAYMAEDLLDRYDVTAAILTGGGAVMAVSGWANPYYATELARAFNDQVCDVWLSADQRYFASVTPALQVPEWAAKEIRRVAPHPRIVQAMFLSNPHTQAFGHPIYDPVHRTCAELGMPFAIHSLGDGLGDSVTSPTASGYPSFYSEYHSGAYQGLVTHLTSFILHGVFDRYPELKLVLVECGVTWIPSVMRRLEAEFKGLRREVPWCKKLPSEYLLEHVRVTTQPFDVSGPDDPIIEALDQMGARDIILYSSDYPHWDTDIPTKIGSLLPAHWRDRVLYENAAELYGIRLPVRP